eukprot:TRINITY_DN2403_c0_g1_i12.p1 TRINITY_DN2403_c0_g1~~TRINITY_DN2403_c0_g1_i12.p1  ORF type:complete len:109 (+),score=1.43 TRINITY_DN2403_c0_g1_i12:1846-2172(+)
MAPSHYENSKLTAAKDLSFVYNFKNSHCYAVTYCPLRSVLATSCYARCNCYSDPWATVLGSVCFGKAVSQVSSLCSQATTSGSSQLPILKKGDAYGYMCRNVTLLYNI